MSGNFVRGDLAVLDKYARVPMALRAALDLVVETAACGGAVSAEASPKECRFRRCTHSGCGTGRPFSSARRLRIRICFYRRQNSEQPADEGESGSPHCPTPPDGGKNSAKSANRLPFFWIARTTLAVNAPLPAPLGMRPLAVRRQNAAHDACAAQQLCLRVC